MAYLAHQRMFDPAFPTGSCYYTKAAFLADLVDNAIEVFAEYAATKPSPLSGALVQTVCGAASRVASDAMAFPHRAFPYAPVIVSWTNPAEAERNIDWARSISNALQPFASGGAYVNDLGPDDGDRVRVAYGGNYERLAALKKKYDPENLFRLNTNIKPGG
jgi:hypothetical protein